MRKIKQLAISIFSLFMFITITFIPVKAASSFTVSGGGTIPEGSTFKVTISVTNMYAQFSASCSGPCQLVSGFPADVDAMGETKSVTATYKATGTGNISVSVSGTGADYDTMEDKSIGGSAKFTVNKKSEKPQTPQEPQKPVVDNRSKDNTLASLTLSEGTLSPAFNAKQTDYTVELKNTVEKITVHAKANHGKAKVSGTGEIALNPGDNTIKIKVTAENGNPKVYTIKAHVDETPLIFTSFNGEELGVVRNLTNAPKLEGFEETKVKIDGKEVKAWHSPVRNVTVVYLQKGDVKDYYIYDDTNGVSSIYQPFVSFGQNLALVTVPTDLQTRVGMKFEEITIGEIKMPGWTFEEKEFADYVLIYALNEKGEYAYYQYEKTEDTLQLYSGAAALTQDSVEKLQAQSNDFEKKMKIGFGVAGVCFLGFVFMAFRSSKYKKLSKRRRSFDEETALQVEKEEIDN